MLNPVIIIILIKLGHYTLIVMPESNYIGRNAAWNRELRVRRVHAEEWYWLNWGLSPRIRPPRTRWSRAPRSRASLSWKWTGWRGFFPCALVRIPSFVGTMRKLEDRHQIFIRRPKFTLKWRSNIHLIMKQFLYLRAIVMITDVRLRVCQIRLADRGPENWIPEPPKKIGTF